VIENTAMAGEQQGPKLQQARIYPNGAAMGTKTKEEESKSAYLWKTSGRQGSPAKCPHLPLPTLK